MNPFGTTNTPSCRCHSDSPFPATGGEIPWTYAHFTEPYIALAMAAAVTERIKLCTGITLLPERNPLILAKQISVLDLHSQGRFRLWRGRRLESGRDHHDGRRFRPPLDPGEGGGAGP